VLNTVTFAEHGGQTTQTSTARVATTFAEQDGQTG
jgi:hypothetical protein